MADDDKFDEEKQRIRDLYEALAAEIVIGENTIAEEMEKDPAERDIGYIVGQSELNVALKNAAYALEQSGLLGDLGPYICEECAKKTQEKDTDTELN